MITKPTLYQFGLETENLVKNRCTGSNECCSSYQGNYKAIVTQLVGNQETTTSRDINVRVYSELSLWGAVSCLGLTKDTIEKGAPKVEKFRPFEKDDNIRK